jgi:hypothetical protein
MLGGSLEADALRIGDTVGGGAKVGDAVRNEPEAAGASEDERPAESGVGSVKDIPPVGVDVGTGCGAAVGSQRLVESNAMLTTITSGVVEFPWIV